MNARTASIVAVMILVVVLVLLLRRGELLGAGPVAIALQVIPESSPVRRVAPEAEFNGIFPNDFLPRKFEPVQKSIVHFDEFAVTHARNARANRAAVEGAAEACLALAEVRCAGAQFFLNPFTFRDIEAKTNQSDYFIAVVFDRYLGGLNQ